MKGKITCLIVSGLMALSLVIAACSPAVVEKPEVTGKPKTEVTEKPEVVEKPEVEKPRYGGIFRFSRSGDFSRWDDISGTFGGADASQLTSEPLIIADWARGPAGGYGSNEIALQREIITSQYDTGRIAESWEIPSKIEGEKATIIVHIRKGIHFALNPASEASRLVGGRELTADDVVFSLKATTTNPRSAIAVRNPEVMLAEVTSPASWTVKIEVPWAGYEVAVRRLVKYLPVFPREVREKYDINKWYNNVGTGAYIITDSVPGSSATLERNPNYWQKDPVGPGKGNQLPYMDGIKWYIIPDKSTTYAAMRTAKIDYVRDVLREDWLQFKKTNPQLVSARGLAGRPVNPMFFKLDRSPFNDIRVRRAMMMAIDFEAIKRDYYQGEAETVNTPVIWDKDYAAALIGANPEDFAPDVPQSVRELFTYNPEKAKQLLAEAGYPNGFKTNVISGSGDVALDYLAILKDMWRKVGVDLEIRPRESAALTAIRRGRDFDGIIVGGVGGVANIYALVNVYGTGEENLSELDDPVINEAYKKIQVAVVEDIAEANRLHREVQKHILDQAYSIPPVTPYDFILWWPWLKGYSGELTHGISFEQQHWIYTWLDQEMKKAMGY